MKAYTVYGADYDNGSAIVFANNVTEAKMKAIGTEACCYDRYIDIRAKRMPLLDGMEDSEPKDNIWLNEEVRTILVRDYSWHCLEPMYEDCKNCCAKEWCSEYEVEE